MIYSKVPNKRPVYFFLKKNPTPTAVVRNLDSDYHISINDKDKIVDNEVELAELFNS